MLCSNNALRRMRAPVGAMSRQTKRRHASSCAVAQDSDAHHYQQQQQQQQRPAGSRRDEFWRQVAPYRDVSTRDFLSYRWSIHNTVQGKLKLYRFLVAVVPDEIPTGRDRVSTQTKHDFLEDVFKGVDASAMSIRITPYVLSRINWNDPRNDPIFRQFIPLKSAMLPDHPKLTLDSLHETADSPVPGLVHRYPDKVLFLVSVCPTYCTYCTRSYAVGADTDAVTKTSFAPTRRRWDAALAYIERTPQVQDVVVSGGDAYYLTAAQVRQLGARLLTGPAASHVRRIRFASKGPAVAPARILDDDGWADALADVAAAARRAGKSVALHTHFNHPDEMSWVTEEASRRLLEAGVTVRNQSVLLRGVNDDVETMARLIRRLADNNISPYYVFLCDMVKMSEHLRTPLQTMLDLEAQLRGSIAGFMMPQFVVDLPGGGGKRLACSYQSYDRATGVSRFVAPAVTARGAGEKPDVYEYYDPVGFGAAGDGGAAVWGRSG